MNEYTLPGKYGELPFIAYWNEYRMDIANWRRWECKSENCPKNCCRNCGQATFSCQATCRNSCWLDCPPQCIGYRLDDCPTLKRYDGFALKLKRLLDMPISQVSPRNITDALDIIQENGYGSGIPYSDNTMESYRTFLRVLFRFAQNHGDAYNFMVFDKALQESFRQVGYTGERYLNREEEKTLLKKIYKRVLEKPRSLTIYQEEHLVQIVEKNINTDGRYLAIALILYAGLRPAECRGLLWRNIVSFYDHPERHLLNIFKTGGTSGGLQDRVKTRNAFRRIPVHCELEGLLETRREFVAGKTSGHYGDLPVCCIGNNFEHFCKEYHFSTFAADLLQKLELGPDDIFHFYIDALLDEDEEDAAQHLTLYVLRKDFWTRLSSSAQQMSSLDKRYVMGHDMVINQVDHRPRYNNENLLWEIAQHMDRSVVSSRRHQPFLSHTMDFGKSVYISNRGVTYIHVPKEVLKKGGTLHFHLTAEMPGEGIQIKVLQRPREKLPISATVRSEPAISRPLIGINCEYENWEAHKRQTHSSCESKKEMPTLVEEKFGSRT